MSHISSRLCRRLQWAELDVEPIRHLITLARNEDVLGVGLLQAPSHRDDVSTDSTLADSVARAAITARQEFTVCGQHLVPMVLEVYAAAAHALPVSYRAAVGDGTAVSAGTVLGTVEGPAPLLLTAERVLLNFIQHLSGIASLTRLHVEAMGDTATRLLDTRKTTPGYRVLEKYAVACGGGWNHRLGLYDRIMLKDNHLASGGLNETDALSRRVQSLRTTYPDIPLEIEIDSPEQLEAVLAVRPEVILLDNFTPDQLRAAVETIAGRAFTEASGGVSLKTLPSLAHLGLDFISCGALTHQSTWPDIGLDWE
jgi:nicotinate-nucleotide pyrophosphorylase (carboxylating)